ncbi:MAG: hypothetical protein GX956_06160 [Firmicutes bacterium]|nr:hypothetical protein [Bacillota bacterium]
MHILSDRAKALLEQLLVWEESAESLGDNLWSLIEKEGADSITLKCAKELKTTGFISWLWTDNRIYWVGINDKAR